MIKPLLILAGTISLIIGIIGIIVPGLPTTVFLLIASACYVRSSRRLYTWLINHRVLGRFIRDYRTYRGMSMRSKIIALLSMWIMILISSAFMIQNTPIRVIVILSGMIGTLVILRIRLIRENSQI